MIAVGATVGHWRILRVLGDHGFVARAAGVAGFDRLVRLKIVDDGHGGAAGLARWAEEAQRTAVAHPGLISLIEAGRAGGDAYIVTDYVPGVTAAELIARGPIAADVVARIGADIAEALAALHDADQSYSRLVATDILVGADGHARLNGYWAGGLPIRPAAPVDRRGEVRALGMVLWEVAAGGPPGARELDEDVPEAIAAVLTSAVAMRPEDRPPDAGMLAAELVPGRAEHTAVAAVVRAVAGHALDEIDAEIGATAVLLGEAAAADPDAPPFLDDNVQFTVYRPRSLTPGRWYPLLAFAHLSERRDTDEASAPDPIEEVRRQAEQVLGAAIQDTRPVTQDARQAVPREGEITFVPEVPGVMFNPPRRSFLWEEAVHREEFRMRAPATLDGKVARGRLTVYLGRLVLAEVSLSIRVDARPAPRNARPVLESEKARAYRRIFASYSHKDTAVVSEVEKYAKALGDEYVRDWVHLRTGEVWSDRLRQLIAGADVFQLFWSHHSMRSPFVRQEWEYALSLGRPSFVRPTYWEDPMPRSEPEGLPPEELLRLHFQRIHALIGAGPSAGAGAGPLAPPQAHKARAEQLARKQDEASRPRAAPAPEAAKLERRKKKAEAGGAIDAERRASVPARGKAPIEDSLRMRSKPDEDTGRMVAPAVPSEAEAPALPDDSMPMSAVADEPTAPQQAAAPESRPPSIADDFDAEPAAAPASGPSAPRMAAPQPAPAPKVQRAQAELAPKQMAATPAAPVPAPGYSQPPGAPAPAAELAPGAVALGSPSAPPALGSPAARTDAEPAMKSVTADAKPPPPPGPTQAPAQAPVEPAPPPPPSAWKSYGVSSPAPPSHAAPDRDDLASSVPAPSTPSPAEAAADAPNEPDPIVERTGISGPRLSVIVLLVVAVIVAILVATGVL